MMKTNLSKPSLLRILNQFAIATAILLFSFASMAQDTVEWTTLGGEFVHPRVYPASPLDARNFSDL